MNKSMRKRYSLKRPLFEALSYIRESKNYIYFIIGVFVVACLAGFFFSAKLSFLNGYLKEIVSKTVGMGFYELTDFIFMNNLQSALLGMLGGIVFSIWSIMVTLLNGMVLGYVFSKSYLASGFSNFWKILPHGVFELPAVLISLGLGTRLGTFIFSRDKMKELKYRAYNSIKVFILVIVPLLVVAAIIEGLLIIFYK